MLAINRLQRFGVSPSTLYRNAAGPESPKMLMMGSQTERHCHPGGVTVADSVPDKLAQAEADELSPRWSTPPCLRPRGAPGPSPAWRAGRSSVEMDAKPISALRIASARQPWRTASDTNAR